MAKAMQAFVRKQFICDSISKVPVSNKMDTGRQRRFVISTGAVDRDNDTINPHGWNLDNFRKNPVVLFAHDYASLPIAKAVSIGVEGDKLVATAEFATHPMAQTCLDLIDGHFLRATSVGFRPTKFIRAEDRDGINFQEAELLEFSCVPVPANPEALIVASAQGIDVSPVQRWAELVMKGLKADVNSPPTSSTPEHVCPHCHAVYVGQENVCPICGWNPYTPPGETRPLDHGGVMPFVSFDDPVNKSSELMCPGCSTRYTGQPGTPCPGCGMADSMPPPLLPQSADTDGVTKVPCPTCDGKGKIRDGHVSCPDCNGTGDGKSVSKGHTRICPACMSHVDGLQCIGCGHHIMHVSGVGAAFAGSSADGEGLDNPDDLLSGGAGDGTMTAGARARTKDQVTPEGLAPGIVNQPHTCPSCMTTHTSLDRCPSCGRAVDADDQGPSVSPMNPLDQRTSLDPVRWNRKLSKAFDVDGEPLQASKLEYTWASRYLNVPVKQIYETGFSIPSPRMGAMLSAFEDELKAAGYRTESVRSVTYGGTEEPPKYDTVQLNSKASRSFLVEGIRFLQGPVKAIVKVQPSWAGLQLSFYVSVAQAEALCEFIAQVRARSTQYKFMRGEAFSLSGEFLTRGDETWDDLFLQKVNRDPLERMVKLLNEQGAQMDSRGVIMGGPPGTGKTLAGRVIMNATADATFIWVTARDFYRSGNFGGITLAFDLAQENAPSVVFIEDADSYLDSETIDLLKTELDGLKQKTGVVTIVTTNFPERIPEALIDRPGRFHDVLMLSLPTESIRRAMLAKWAPTAKSATLDTLAKDTQAFSGAHLRELVRFAGVIHSQDGVTFDDALARALVKVREQRDLIDSTRRQGRTVLRQVKMAGAKRMAVKGVNPGDVSTSKAPEDQAWSAPSLKDLTDKGWTDLSDAEKRKVAGHYALADEMPPKTFGSLHLPHHDTSGSIVWRGVAAAAARMGQAASGADLGIVKAHLAKHYKAFGKDAPWDAASAAWEGYAKASVGVPTAKLPALLRAYGFKDMADALSMAAADEASELVQYKTIETMLDSIQALWTAADGLNDALIAQHTNRPDGVVSGGDAEDMLENARLESIVALCEQMESGLRSVCSLAKDLVDDYGGGGYDDTAVGIALPPGINPSMIPGQPNVAAVARKTVPAHVADAIREVTAAGYMVVEKRGRVISAANEKRLQAAHDAAMTCAAHVKSVVDQIGQNDDTHAGDDDHQPGEKPGGDLGDDGKKPPKIVDAEVVKIEDVEFGALTRALGVVEEQDELPALVGSLETVMRGVLASAVQESVGAAIRRSRGVVD